MKVGRRETVRRTLKSFRATVGLSQLAVAERMGIPEKRYWRIENGYEEPSDSERGKLAKALKVDDAALPFAAHVEAQAS
jgi:transcriptional regulator with XRE-family HTH domain